MWKMSIVCLLPPADQPHTLALNGPQNTNTDTDAYRLSTNKVRYSVSK